MYKSIDVLIDENSIKTLFLKKSKPNIYSIFRNLNPEIVKHSKFRNIKIEFHIGYDKGDIFFTRYISYKSGRTIFSCTKEMIKFLIDWRVDGVGHFLIFLEKWGFFSIF